MILGTTRKEGAENAHDEHKAHLFPARLDEYESASANPYLMEQSKSRRRLARSGACFPMPPFMIAHQSIIRSSWIGLCSGFDD
jgi:hypothetical protein